MIQRPRALRAARRSLLLGGRTQQNGPESPQVRFPRFIFRVATTLMISGSRTYPVPVIGETMPFPLSSPVLGWGPVTGEKRVTDVSEVTCIPHVHAGDAPGRPTEKKLLGSTVYSPAPRQRRQDKQGLPLSASLPHGREPQAVFRPPVAAFLKIVRAKQSCAKGASLGAHSGLQHHPD